MKEHINTIAVLDIGSAKTVALICEIGDSGLRYRGHGMVESRGSRKGIITELDKAVHSVHKAVDEAEKLAGCSIECAVVSVGGPHIKGVTSRGGVTLGSRPREVTRDDIRTAVEKARSVSLPPDREILHLLPQEFILDDQPGVRDPRVTPPRLVTPLICGPPMETTAHSMEHPASFSASSTALWTLCTAL